MLKLQVTLLSAALVVAALAPSITAAPIPATHAPFFVKRADASFLVVAPEHAILQQSSEPLAGERRSPYEPPSEHEIWGDSHRPQDPPKKPENHQATSQDTRGDAYLPNDHSPYADQYNWKPTFVFKPKPQASVTKPAAPPQDTPKPVATDETTVVDRVDLIDHPIVHKADAKWNGAYY